MCDIKHSTKLKRKTVYKAAWLIKGKYYSAFSHHELRLGKVVTFPDRMKKRSLDMFKTTHNSLIEGSNLYNINMLGRVSGFALKSDAIDLCTKDRPNSGFIEFCLNKGYTIVVLKIVISGSILHGTAINISNFIPDGHNTYAGDHIDSIKEIFTHKL